MDEAQRVRVHRCGRVGRGLLMKYHAALCSGGWRGELGGLLDVFCDSYDLVPQNSLRRKLSQVAEDDRLILLVTKHQEYPEKTEGTGSQKDKLLRVWLPNNRFGRKPFSC